MAIKKFIPNLTQNLRRDYPGNAQNGEGRVHGHYCHQAIVIVITVVEKGYKKKVCLNILFSFMDANVPLLQICFILRSKCLLTKL